MQIYVCVKHVPDTAANIKIVGENGFDDAGCKFIANPYDEYAVEQAVQLVEKNGGEVIVVTVGKAVAAATIRAAMAMGAHRGILITVDSQFLDSQTTAQALKVAIEQDGKPDIIFTGKGAVDSEGFQTLYRLAAGMNLPVVNEINKMEYPKFPDIMKAKKKEIKQITIADLGISVDGAQSELEKLEKTPDRSGAKMLEGDVRQAVEELVNILKEEEKVI
ncbi:MAG: electron transfer flavoprotein subunit beta/FixA family protein [Desulfosarcina sp.]|nr:electron transfer flavoprotein subunit beta/FixA family protein [Desulfosarcina sp.]MBC2767535.1 electron transfer flavoprotein subunit beta/FixA family protein [Desulfosarcina sp.]